MSNKTEQRNILLLIILILTFFIFSTVFFSTNKNSSCQSTLTPRNGDSICNFTIANSSNLVKFSWCLDYHGEDVYPNQVPGLECEKPNYNKVGWGHWTYFGDGRYSWDEHPEHVYEFADTYDDVYTEKTPIKNGGGPPPLVNKLDNDQIIVCPDGGYSKDKNDLLDEEDEGIAFDESRPPYCDYTFVQIIRFKIGEDKTAKKLRITYNSDHFGPPSGMSKPFILPYNRQKYQIEKRDPISKEDNENDMEIILDISQAEPEIESAVCIQFYTKCNEGEPSICAEFLDQDDEAISDKVYDKKKIVKDRKPFDPNWIEIPSELSIFADDPNPQKHRVKAYFYFFDNGANKDLCVDVKIRELGDLIERYKPIDDSRFIDTFPNSANGIDFTSTTMNNARNPCTKFSGEGNKNPNYPTLGMIEFDIILRPNLLVTDSLKLELSSHFHGIDSYSSIDMFPVYELEVDTVDYTF